MRHRGYRPRCRRRIYRCAPFRCPCRGRQLPGRHCRAGEVCPPLQCPYLCHPQYHPEGRRAPRNREAHLGLVSCRGRCPHCAGHGLAQPEPPSDTPPCQHADGQPHGRQGEVPSRSRIPSGGLGTRTLVGADSQDTRGRTSDTARSLRARGVVREL